MITEQAIRKQVRCAIYTRKSSEEGLDQEFNSLDSQREACAAYILSQKHEGWLGVSGRYDDGGWSGGTMDRPALNRLLADVRDHRVDTIVVYKVDRLTRSLMDFAKIVEVLDSHSVSFVSVTQQFNTTTSMGRLTLNVLLSFAQFEREITGERIRDKIAASRKKGMWTGGTVPLGYKCHRHRLVVNPKEAQTVRNIFQQYLKLRCVRKLKQELGTGKTREAANKSAQTRLPSSRGALYHLLKNRIYLGEIVHRGVSYRGLHSPIVSRRLWHLVANRLTENTVTHKARSSTPNGSMLSGKLFDQNGLRFTPTHAVKNKKRYRYYTSQTVLQRGGDKPAVTRFPAAAIEELIATEVQTVLRTPSKWINVRPGNAGHENAIQHANALAKNWHRLDVCKKRELIRTILSRVVVHSNRAVVEIDKTRLLAVVNGQATSTGVHSPPSEPDILTRTLELTMIRRGRELRLIFPSEPPDNAPIPSLLHAFARSLDWRQKIVDGEIANIKDLVRKSGLSQAYVRRILRCAFISPRVIESVIDRKCRVFLTLEEFHGQRSLDWTEHEDALLTNHLPRKLLR